LEIGREKWNPRKTATPLPKMIMKRVIPKIVSCALRINFSIKSMETPTWTSPSSF